MPHSKKPLWMMLMPNTGNVVTNTGSNAQCIAHATDVAIPKASQFNFIFIGVNSKDTIFAMSLQKRLSTFAKIL